MQELFDSINPIIIQISVFIVISLFIYVSAKKILNRFYPILQKQDKWYSIKRIVMITIYIIISLVFLITFVDKFEGFYTVLGLAGAGVTFALREVIVSIAGWFAIIFGNFFKVGDRVLLGGIVGDVIDLGVFRTTLMDTGDWVNGNQYNGRIVRVANNFVFTSPVYNYSADFQFLWDEINVPIHFGSDIKLFRRILTEVADEVIEDVSEQAKEDWFEMRRQYKLEDAQLDHQVFMIFNDNWIEFSLRYIVDIRARRRTKDRLFTRLLEEIENQKGLIDLASETFEIVDDPNKESTKTL